MFTIDLEQALAGLNRIASLNMAPWLAEVGRKEVAVIEDRIMHTKGSPDMIAWSPWRPMTERLRAAKGNLAQGLLWDEGNLLRSIRFESSLFDVSIGTDITYAKELQEGRSNMAARPFIGWGDEELGSALELSATTQTLEASAIAFIEGLNK